MSQLELALKKARASAADLESDVVTPGRPVPNAAFVSAWAVEDAPALPRRDVTPVPDSPAVEPHTHKASRAVDTTSRFKDFSEDVRPKLVIGEQALPDMREQFGKIAAVLYRLREAQPEQRVKVTDGRQRRARRRQVVDGHESRVDAQRGVQDAAYC